MHQVVLKLPIDLDFDVGTQGSDDVAGMDDDYKPWHFLSCL